MTIPQVREQRIQPGTILVNRRAVWLDAALEDAREGVLAILGLGEANPGEAGVMIRFRLNTALAAEQYSIKTGRRDVIVEAGGIPGAVYAASTIAQRCAAHDDTLSYGEIEDAPTYPWRGLLVDVCRHFFPMRTLKTIVDLMAYYKYNRLHLHLTEDQGFRFESERFPLLNSVGSYRKSTFVKHTELKGEDGVLHGGFYTKAELRELVRYAKARGIEIVPEIDMPGHALSMIAAYPDLACISEPVEVATRFGVTDFSKKLLCAGNEKTFEFLFSLFDEVMEIFPFPYLHVGGDEALKSEWKRCERCQRVMREQGLKNERELQGYFLNRVIAFLEERGRKAIVWNDGLCDTLSKSAIVQYWTPLTHNGFARMAQYVNAGGKAILSPVTRVYYDYPYAATPLKKTFEYRPTLRGVRKKQQENILGVEAAIWTEWIDTEEKLFFNTLPRLAATAESGWAAPDKANYDAFIKRLQPHYRLYERLGLRYAKKLEKSMQPFKRLHGALTFVTKETHAEVNNQQNQESYDETEDHKYE
ncbi:MAG: beta-N-acetylhexosaminidase [Christensenella sp.]|nr:beta-N-acetylhexosaminidase [Christensenella sp.]